MMVENSNVRKMLKDKDTQFKVDNWGSFFLHRLNLLYEKGDYCDAKLMFKDGSSIKAHKLVLMTCTDYFKSEQSWVNGEFMLPPSLQRNAVQPIVNFMYTGTLTFKPDIHHNVFTAAKFLNVTILMKLLTAQLRNDLSNAPAASESASTTSSSTASSSSSSTPSSTPLSKKGVKRISLTPSSGVGSRGAASSSQTGGLPGRRLPFWKKRTSLSVGGVAGASFATAEMGGGDAGASSGPATPYRFDWSDPTLEENVEKLPNTQCPRYNCISFTSQMLIKPTDLKRPINQVTSEISEISKKRPHMDDLGEKENVMNNNFDSEIVGHHEDDDDDDDDDRHFDPDHQSAELMATGSDEGQGQARSSTSADLEQERRSGVSLNGGDSVPGAGKGSSEDMFDRLAKLKSLTPRKPILKALTTTEHSSASTTPVVGRGGGAGLATPPSAKKVRFSLTAAEGKENAESADSSLVSMVTAEVTPTTTVFPAKLVTKETAAALAAIKNTKTSSSVETAPAVVTSRVSITGDKSSSFNHSKILSELVKKNPDLIKNNRNLKVSIFSGDKSKSDKDIETRVSYVVMKQPVGGGEVGSAGKSGGGKLGAKLALPSGGGGGCSGAENMKGPWLCEDCGVGGKPMNFETYYLYRRHLHDVHQERIDARICEHCGYKSSKRNLHLYHLFTKHGVPPPRNIRFPRCDKCTYVALSDSLLIKHKNNHQISAEKVSCKACNMHFKSQASLQCHLQTCPHNNAVEPVAAVPAKEYPCEYCQKPFSRYINLTAHLRTAHKDESRRLYDEEEQEQEAAAALAAARVGNVGSANATDVTATIDSNLLQVIRLPMVDGGEEEGGGGQRAALMFLTAGTSGATATTAVTSSEQEAMTTVASGIAASLNLADSSCAQLINDQTVILLDGTSELVFESGGSVMLTQDAMGGPGCSVQEYIVPEIISTSDQRIFETTSVSTSPDSQATAEQQQQQTVIVSEAAGQVGVAMGAVTVVGVGMGIHEEAEPIGRPTVDHTYADADTKDDTLAMHNQHDDAVIVIEDRVDASAPEIKAELTSDAQVIEIGESQSDADEVGSTDNSTAINRRTESQSFGSSTFNITDNSSNFMKESGKRETIIIETSTLTNAHAHDTTVIVSAPSAVGNKSISSSSMDLAKEWDDFGDGEGEGELPSTSSCTTVASSSQLPSVNDDDVRPSRATIDLDQSILSDI